MNCAHWLNAIPLLFLVLVMQTASVRAQVVVPPASDSTQYELVLDDGSRLKGVILGSDADAIRISTAAMGEVRVAVSRIVSMTRIGASGSKSTVPTEKVDRLSAAVKEPLPEEVRWFRERHTGRYFLAPSAHPLKAGEGYYRNTYLLLQTFAVGVTDHISLSAGFEALSLFAFSRNAPGFHVGAKTAWRLAPKFHVGASATYVNLPDQLDTPFSFDHHTRNARNDLGIFHGFVTFGTERIHGTLGGGVRYDARARYEVTPSFSGAIAARLIPKLWVISETWILGDELDFIPVWSLGLRFAGRRAALDFGFANTSEFYDEVFVGIPFIACSINFGKLAARPRK